VNNLFELLVSLASWPQRCILSQTVHQRSSVVLAAFWSSHLKQAPRIRHSSLLVSNSHLLLNNSVCKLTHYRPHHTAASTLVTSRWMNHIPAFGTYVAVPPWFSARVPDIFVAVLFRRTYSPATSLCFVFWPESATDNSLHHRWTVFPVSISIHVECSASFFHISVTVQKSTQDRTIRVFIPAILLNLSLRHCDSLFLFRDIEVFGFTSR